MGVGFWTRLFCGVVYFARWQALGAAVFLLSGARGSCVVVFCTRRGFMCLDVFWIVVFVNSGFLRVVYFCALASVGRSCFACWRQFFVIASGLPAKQSASFFIVTHIVTHKKTSKNTKTDLNLYASNRWLRQPSASSQ